MEPHEDLRNRLALPPISQLGIVVRDMARAVAFYEHKLGLGPWTVYEGTPDKYWFKGKPSHMRLRQGKTMLGDIDREVVQPLEGGSPFHEFAASQGEGLHHVPFHTDDFDTMVRKFHDAGFASLLLAEAYVPTYGGTVRACHFDTRAVGGVIFEVVWESWLVR